MSMSHHHPYGVDRARVLRLLRQHLPSGFEPEPSPATGPLTIGEVTARMLADRVVPTADRGAALGMVALDEALPPALRVRDLEALCPSVVASPAFWRDFRATALGMGLGRAQGAMVATCPRGAQS